MPRPNTFIEISDVEHAFDVYLALTSGEQRTFSAMLKGREWAAPPAQATIPIAGAPKRSHKKPKTAPAPAQAEEGKAQSA